MDADARGEPVQPGREPPAGAQENGGSASHRHLDRWLIVGLPLTVAVLSFALSLYTWFQNNQPPEVELSMPDRVRVTQGFDGAWLYIQPRFVSTSSNDRIDVITSIEVDVVPSGDGQSATFGWDEQGTWTFNHEARSLSWQWVADPGPLVVSPANPQQPTGLFMAEDGWFWEAGSYEMTVTSQTSVSDKTLTETSMLELSDSDLERLNSAQGSIFLTIGLER